MFFFFHKRTDPTWCIVVGTCPPNSDCKTDPHVTEGYIEPQERQSVKGQSLPDTPEAAEFKTEHPKYFILEPEKSQLHKAQPVSDDNKHRTEYSEPSVAVECKKTNYLVILPCCDVSCDFTAAKTINPIRIPPTTPVNKNNHHLSLIVERWVHRVSFHSFGIAFFKIFSSDIQFCLFLNLDIILVK
jgi:hypothetical protein